MSKISDAGYEIRPILICTEHHYLTYAPCLSHGDAHAVKRWEIRDRPGLAEGKTFDYPCYRPNGDKRIYQTYSGAYSFVMRSAY